MKFDFKSYGIYTGQTISFETFLLTLYHDLAPSLRIPVFLQIIDAGRIYQTDRFPHSASILSLLL